MNSTRAASSTARLDPIEAQHADEVSHGERFEFGKNWSHFLSRLNDDRIQRAERSLSEMLGVQTLAGKRFLDVGSGSGLFSLAARRLGATVHSFDYDPNSVACTRELRRRYFGDDLQWKVEGGSALDSGYLQSLGSFDVVYAWGVLHHTGQMWDALANVRSLVAPGGTLFIAIYNDKGPESTRWRKLKRIYCSLPGPIKPVFAAAAMLPYEVKDVARSLLALRPQDYVRSWTRYSSNRGMSRWHDVIDWAGGYPYEVATADEIIDFYDRAGFAPQRVNRTNGLGCNEFVFVKSK
jgi:2-polyprenyl-6-hydroxyphenyl methylase/3-demethylubiquinone-9 3-methyltransferase